MIADSGNAFLEPASGRVRPVCAARRRVPVGPVVKKLKAARDRKKIETGQKVEGRKSLAEMRPIVAPPWRQGTPGKT